MPTITAAHLYDHVACPHRVYLDNFGPLERRDEISPFVRLLWERGSSYEDSVVAALPDGKYVSLRELPPESKQEATLEAMRNGAPLIYGGRGRALRDGMVDHLTCIDDFAECDPEAFVSGKKTVIPKLGVERLRLFHQRAKLLTDPNAKPYLRDVVVLPSTDLEIFFDIEADPMNDIVYLHGFVERTGRDPATEKFTAFFADANSEEAERQAFAGAIAWMQERSGAAIYYYSKYERTMYRKLCERHPGVCTQEDIEDLFQPPRATDLYFDVVTKATEWPTTDHSIKTLAKYLGFSWRDADPSGAASIEWYQRWAETGDDAIRQRILDHNEDDCRATAVLLDGIRNLAA